MLRKEVVILSVLFLITRAQLVRLGELGELGGSFPIAPSPVVRRYLRPHDDEGSLPLA
jgi:hypothetical protein